MAGTLAYALSHDTVGRLPRLGNCHQSDVLKRRGHWVLLTDTYRPAGPYLVSSTVSTSTSFRTVVRR